MNVEKELKGIRIACKISDWFSVNPNNVPHHSDLSTFPHHKHLSNSVVESGPVNLRDVVEEIIETIVG